MKYTEFPSTNRGRATEQPDSAFRVRRAGKTVRVCAVVLAAGTVLIPAAAASADADPVYEYNYREVASGTYQQTIPFEANVSKTSVSGAGELLNFRFSLRADEWKPGWLYRLDAFRLTLDLSSLADDVVDIEAVLDSLDFTPIRNLEMTVNGNSVEFFGEIDRDAPQQFEVKFSVEVESGGDGIIDLPASFATRGTNDPFSTERWDYGPAGETSLPVVVAHPAPFVTKTVDRSQVSKAKPEVKYTIAVKRPEGAAVPQYFLIEEELTDVIQEAAGLAPTDFVIEQGAGNVSVNGDRLLGEGVYDENGEWAVTFSTPHLGTGDGILTNTVCVQSPARMAVSQKDPSFPVTWQQGGRMNTVEISVPGESACADSPKVIIKDAPAKPGEVDAPTKPGEVDAPTKPGETEDEFDPSRDETVTSNPIPELNEDNSTPRTQLATTGTQHLEEKVLVGALFAVTGGLIAGAAAFLRRLRLRK